MDSVFWLLAGTGVLLIGISKAGFGGGLGMLTTPLVVLALGRLGQAPAFAIGVLLPLLIAGDLFSLWHYRGQGRSRVMWLLLPGVVGGVVVGVQCIDRFSSDTLTRVIGGIAVAFVIFQWVKDYVLKAEGTFDPGWGLGTGFGLAAGLTSSFAHGAGPVMSMYLIPQKMPKDVHVATRVLIFTWINWIKVPFFALNGVMSRETLYVSLMLLALVPVGVWIGVKLNKKFSEEGFLKAVYVLTLLAGLQLLFHWKWVG